MTYIEKSEREGDRDREEKKGRGKGNLCVKVRGKVDRRRGDKERCRDVPRMRKKRRERKS